MDIGKTLRGAGIEARERFLALLRENFPLHKENYDLRVYECGKHLQF